MKNKLMLLASGACLSLGFVNVVSADARNLLQLKKLKARYSNTNGNLKLAEDNGGSIS